MGIVVAIVLAHGYSIYCIPYAAMVGRSPLCFCHVLLERVAKHRGGDVNNIGLEMDGSQHCTNLC